MDDRELKVIMCWPKWTIKKHVHHATYTLMLMYAYIYVYVVILTASKSTEWFYMTYSILFYCAHNNYMYMANYCFRLTHSNVVESVQWFVNWSKTNCHRMVMHLHHSQGTAKMAYTQHKIILTCNYNKQQPVHLLSNRLYFNYNILMAIIHLVESGKSIVTVGMVLRNILTKLGHRYWPSFDHIYCSS